jgi:hypothetical protein
MPRVPTYDNFTVAPSSQPGARIDAPDTSGIGSIPARQAQELGQGLMKAGNAATQIAISAAEEAKRTRVADGMNKYVTGATGLELEARQFRGRSALERPDGAALPDEYGKKLEDLAREIEQGLGNEAQKREFRMQAAPFGQRLRKSLSEHMVHQQRTFDKETDLATIETAQNRGALLWGDKKAVEEATGAIDFTLGQMAQREGWDDKIKEAKRIEALSPMHGAILKSMIDIGKTDEARAYYEQNSAGMGLQLRANVMHAINTAEVDTRTQAGAADLWAKHGGDITAALSEARTAFAGKDEDGVVTRLKTYAHEAEAAKTQAAKQNSSTAWSLVVGTPSLSAIPKTLWAGLPGEEQRQIKDWVQAKARQREAEAKGKFETDMQVYYGLRQMATENPSAFANLNLMKSSPYLKDNDLKHLMELQSQLSRSDARAMEQQRVVKNTLSLVKADAASVGIDLTPDDRHPEKAKETAAFLARLTMSLDLAQAQKGQPLSSDEARVIGRNALRQEFEQGSGVFGFFQGKKLGYQIPDDRRDRFVVKPFADIGEADRQRIETRIRADGRQPSPEEVERVYSRGVRAGIFKE